MSLSWSTKDSAGSLGHELVLRDREADLEIVTIGRPWSFDGDGATLRLLSEAHRIRLAHLFDPLLAVHTSLVEPLPHQITAVYGEMIPRQPLRFLLADDPGAGKTIMAGLLMRELLIRGDLHRCLVVCPGSLAAQWQDELFQKFHLPFEILTNDRIEAARTGNAFAEIPLLIVRLDKLSRNDDLQAKLAQVDWDLVVCDEAHKLSASFFGGEIKETKRYKLGKLLSTLTRHFLLMTATPHNGNHRSLRGEEKPLVEPVLEEGWLRQDLESQATGYAITHLIPDHLHEVRQRKEELIAKTLKTVKERLTKEINYWDQRAEELKRQEASGKTNAKLNAAKARARADDLESRLQKRLVDLEQERRLPPLPPVVIGGALVVPIGLLQRLQGKRHAAPKLFARETKRVELLAMQAVMAAERKLGHALRDVSPEKCGYDIESRVPGTEAMPGKIRFIEVKGRIEGSDTVTVSKNEILTALNKPDSFILALVQVPKSEEFAEGGAFKVSTSKGKYSVGDDGCAVRYVQQPFQKEPDFGVTSVNYGWQELWERGSQPD